MLIWHRHCRQPRTADGDNDCMRGGYLGPTFEPDEIATCLDGFGAEYTRHKGDALCERVAALLAAGHVVGWFDGRMEFGPRALGARSILADPRNPRMQAQLNLKIKFREGFRPFAPSIIVERVRDYFELECESPYMLLVAPVRPDRRVPMTPDQQALFGIDKLNVKRSDIPAVTHVDYSARVQTVRRETNPKYHQLLAAFERLTGCPVLVNTSFNVRGEPIVCTPADAYRCFMRTDMDHLAVGPFLLDKAAQPKWRESSGWKNVYELD